MPSAIQSVWRVSEKQVEVLSKHTSEVLPFSVMLTGPYCQSDRAAHQTSAPTLLSHTMGAQKRCQIIWQVKWDIFIRSSTPSQTGAKVSWGSLPSVQTSAIKMKPAWHFTRASRSRSTLSVHFFSRLHGKRATKPIMSLEGRWSNKTYESLINQKLN